MKISIAMATYDGAAYLEQQLSSFARQERLPDELVVSDDGSTDNTLQILEAFKDNAPFSVKIHRNETNLGHGQNFSKVFSCADGDLIFPSDQDDVWMPCKLRVMEEIAKNNPKHACFLNDAIITDSKLSQSGITKMSQLKNAGLPETSFVMGCCSAIRKDFLDLATPIPPGLHAHDSWIIGLSDMIGASLRERTPLQYYRRHGNNVSNTFFNSTRDRNQLHYIISKYKKIFSRLLGSDNLILSYMTIDESLKIISRNVDKYNFFANDIRISQLMDELSIKRSYLRRRLDQRKISRYRRIAFEFESRNADKYRRSPRDALKDLIANRIECETYDPWKI